MTDKMNKDTEQKIQQLQLLEQNMQQLAGQRQQIHSQLLELESALTELKDSKESYKIIGNIMIKTEKADLNKDLNSKREMIDLKIKSIEKQEKQFKDKASSLQAEVMKSLQAK
jgi:prefoldin beta subunit